MKKKKGINREVEDCLNCEKLEKCIPLGTDSKFDEECKKIIIEI